MSVSDPYITLGVARAADAATIKSAYRQRVRTAHPDRGGEADEFIAIVAAFGVLSDPIAKRLYDETGQIDEDGVRDYRHEVAVILADMFDVAVSTALGLGLPLTSVDFIDQMSSVVQTQISEADQKRLKSNSEIEALETLRARIRRRDGAANLFVERLNAQIKAKVQAHHACLRRLSLLQSAASELGNYDSEVELFSALDLT
jgi:curved DNA-binding protein CbpA